MINLNAVFIIFLSLLIFNVNIISHTHQVNGCKDVSLLVGKWELHQKECINIEKIGQEYDYIKISETEIEYYQRNFKSKNLIKSENINFLENSSNSEKLFQTIINNHTELWWYSINEIKTRLHIQEVNNSSAKKSLLNQLNSGYFERVE